jgi:hypothetical protein
VRGAAINEAVTSTAVKVNTCLAAWRRAFSRKACPREGGDDAGLRR